MASTPPTHGLDQLDGDDVPQIHRGRVQAGLAQLLLDERDGDALDGKLGGAGVAQTVGVDALLNARPGRQAGEELADVFRSSPYKKVKANQGAAGVDGESIAEFEKDLKGNL